jgi:hypothetical protein
MIGCDRAAFALLALIGSAAAAEAEVAGPPLPARPAISPAQAAMTKYQGDYLPSAPQKPCERPKNGEIVVCAVDGRGGSSDRLPLPDELGSRDRTRLATGEAPHIAVGGSPVRNPPGTGLTLTLKGGKTTIAGNSGQ